MIKKLCDMVEMLIKGEYDPLRFSFDFPDAIIEHWDIGEKENANIMKIFDDKIPDICAEFERGSDSKLFVEKIKTEYKRVKNLL